MDYLPVFMNMAGRRALVAGGSLRAARKAELLLRAGAEVVVVAPDLEGEFAELAARGGVVHRPGQLAADMLAGCGLAYGASDDETVNRQLYDLAVAAGIPVNIVDQPELCTFIMPAVIDRSPLMVAISTGGRSPALARLLKERLEALLPGAYGRLAQFAGRYRARIKQRLPDETLRRRFWENVVRGPIAERVFAGRDKPADELMEEAVERATEPQSGSPVGEVYLVGAGPGDPDLLTFRALRLMQQADVVLYDRLIGEAILGLVRRDAERIYVGKMPENHTLPQSEIAALLVRLARQGKRVLRLKGGDPFIFGRGGEEIEALADEGIAFQVVPGVTAANGCAAYAGIPLTHRDHAQACVFVTGHGKEGDLGLNWDALIQPRQTVVIYMGLSSLAEIARQFMAHGAGPGTPAAVVGRGTRREQRVAVGTLETLAEEATRTEIGGPALIIIGSVVSLRGKLSWFAGAETANRHSG
jgi:uroporphyrin-III C-methyltransferase/precorrin-2 dehydrogenase/sirohydrochlorin ferrochelatase